MDKKRQRRNERIRAERPTRTLADLGKEYGLTGEAIRLICLGIEGPKKPPHVCIACDKPIRRFGGMCSNCNAEHEVHRVWTREACIETLKRFEREFGRRPYANDFSPSTARKRNDLERVKRFEENDWMPHVNTFIQRFGTFNEAMIAAGFLPNGPGQYDRSKMRKDSPADLAG